MPEEPNSSDGEETLPPGTERDETIPSTGPRETARPTVQLNADSQAKTAADRSARYHVSGEIARGGMGAVLEARDRSLDRDVAMKVMVLELGASAESRERFIREAKVLGQLEHPNIVPIHELGRDEVGRLFYTMKKVEGRTLQAVIDTLRAGASNTLAEFSLDQLLSVFLKICDAVAFAHSRGVIHRDLKPENVMIGAFGEVLVMDWGLAKILGEDESPPQPVPTSNASTADSSTNLTMEGAVIGSPRYMSPEQASGRTTEIGERSDVFSLGGILYSILTLRPPVQGDSVQEVLDNVRVGNITPPMVDFPSSKMNRASNLVATPADITNCSHLPGGRIPKALSAVAMRALALIAKDRYPSVSELSNDVAAYQAGYATSAEDVGFIGQLRLLIGRHKGISTSVAIAFLVLGVLSVGFVLRLNDEKIAALKSEGEARNAEAAARRAEGEAEAAKLRAIQDKEAARRAMAQTSVALAEAAFRDGNGIEMERALAQVPEALRDSDWRYLHERSDSSTVIEGDFAKMTAVASSEAWPDQLVGVNSHGEVSFFDVTTGKRMRVIEAATDAGVGREFRLSLAPDGRRFALGAGRSLSVHDARSGEELHRWPATGTSGMEFSKDGRLLLQRGRDDGGRFHLNVFDLVSGKKLWRSSSRRNLAACFMSEGNQMLICASTGGLRVVDSFSGEDIRVVKDKTKAYHIALSSQGVVALADMSKSLHLIDLKTGNPISKVNIAKLAVSRLDSIRWTPDGQKLVTFGELNNRHVISVWRAKDGILDTSFLGGKGRLRSSLVLASSGAVSTLSGDGVIRTWNASVAPVFETRHPGVNNGANFWGNEGTFITSRSQADSHMVIRIASEALMPVWRPDKSAYENPSVNRLKDVAVALVANTPWRLGIFHYREGQTTLSNHIKLLSKPRLWKISPAGNHVVVISGTHGSQSMAVYSTESGSRLMKASPNTGRANSITWVADGSAIVVAEKGRTQRGRLSLWDVATGEMICEVSTTDVPMTLESSANGLRFAEAGFDFVVRIRDAGSLKVKSSFRVHDARIRSLAWHPTRPILATASEDYTLRIWNLEKPVLLDEAYGVQFLKNLSFNPRGNRLMATGSSSSLQIWEFPCLQASQQ